MKIELGPNYNNFRPDPYRLIKKLLQYDVISFDIFDTLLLRPFTKPTDLFLTLSPHYNIPNFSTERINAEKRARRNQYLNEGHYEVNIFDIYEELSKSTGINLEQGVYLELEKEKQYCYPNPYMKRVFDMLLENQKRIILISDMYYPESLMKKYMSVVITIFLKQVGNFLKLPKTISRRALNLFILVIIRKQI
jgi:predicted HAD superfamily hydrolase